MRYRVIQTITMMEALAKLSNICALAASSPASWLSSYRHHQRRRSSDCHHPQRTRKHVAMLFMTPWPATFEPSLSSDWATDHRLQWSWRSATFVGGDYANPTEIGLYALS
jgi:hypothetical protein